MLVESPGLSDYNSSLKEAAMRSQRSMLLFFRSWMLCLAGLILLVTACGGSGSTAPDVKQLIKEAQAAIRQVSSYHFKIVTHNTRAGAKLPVTSADGANIVPDKLKAHANAT